MRLKILNVSAILLFFPVNSHAAISNSEDKTGQQPLKLLKDVHIYNSIHHDYLLGGSSPFDE